MSIGERVADLSEIDAKTALLYMLRSAERALECATCPAGCEKPSREMCINRILDEALKEAV